jgi:hypothetical protein
MDGNRFQSTSTTTPIPSSSNDPKSFPGAVPFSRSHRLLTIIDSDRILLLDKGQVSGYDTPAALMQRGGARSGSSWAMQLPETSALAL